MEIAQRMPIKSLPQLDSLLTKVVASVAGGPGGFCGER
jgi:hypothetical protein